MALPRDELSGLSLRSQDRNLLIHRPQPVHRSGLPETGRRGPETARSYIVCVALSPESAPAR
jgi:hypothetical protein